MSVLIYLVAASTAWTADALDGFRSGWGIWLAIAATLLFVGDLVVVLATREPEEARLLGLRPQNRAAVPLRKGHVRIVPANSVPFDQDSA